MSVQPPFVIPWNPFQQYPSMDNPPPYQQNFQSAFQPGVSSPFPNCYMTPVPTMCFPMNGMQGGMPYGPFMQPPQMAAVVQTPQDNAAGTTYLYPAKTTTLHVIFPPFDPVQNRPDGFDFNRYRAPCAVMAVQELIELLAKDREGLSDPEKLGVCEVIKQGDRVSWVAEHTTWYKDDEAKEMLETLGWDETRGVSQEPVWLIVKLKE